jgi:hypothetical protein
MHVYFFWERIFILTFKLTWNETFSVYWFILSIKNLEMVIQMWERMKKVIGKIFQTISNYWKLIPLISIIDSEKIRNFLDLFASRDFEPDKKLIFESELNSFWSIWWYKVITGRMKGVVSENLFFLISGQTFKRMKMIHMSYNLVADLLHKIRWLVKWRAEWSVEFEGIIKLGDLEVTAQIWKWLGKFGSDWSNWEMIGQVSKRTRSTTVHIRRLERPRKTIKIKMQNDLRHEKKVTPGSQTKTLGETDGSDQLTCRRTHSRVPYTDRLTVKGTGVTCELVQIILSLKNVIIETWVTVRWKQSRRTQQIWEARRFPDTNKRMRSEINPTKQK